MNRKSPQQKVRCIAVKNVSMKSKIKGEVWKELIEKENIPPIDVYVRQFSNFINKTIDLAIQKTAEAIFDDVEKTSINPKIFEKLKKKWLK